MTKMIRSPIVYDDGFTLYPSVTASMSVWSTEAPNVVGESSTQLFPLGSKLIRGDEIWRYCRAGGTALDIAAPVQSAAAVHAEQDDDIVVGAASAIGATTVTLTSTANLDGAPNNVANSFADGYLIVNDEAGEGQCYRIKSNEALVTTGDSVFTLYDALTIALTTSSQCGIVMCAYNKVIATAAVVTGAFVGIPQLAVTADYYFWCKSGGAAAAVPQAAIAKGSHVVVGVTAAKVNTETVAAGGAGGETAIQIVIGHCLTPGVADTESCIVFLTSDR